MRWNGLFADLEAQAGALERLERSAEVDERVRGELARIALRDRLRASSAPVRCELLGGHVVSGRVVRAGAQWLLFAGSDGGETVVRDAAVRLVRDLPRIGVAQPLGAVDSRLDLRSVLRAVVRDRAAVTLLFVDGTRMSATLDRVGADYVEAALHPGGEARRGRDVREVVAVALAALAAAVRRP